MKFPDVLLQKVSMWSDSDIVWLVVIRRHKRKEKANKAESYFAVAMLLLF